MVALVYEFSLNHLQNHLPARLENAGYQFTTLFVRDTEKYTRVKAGEIVPYSGAWDNPNDAGNLIQLQTIFNFMNLHPKSTLHQKYRPDIDGLRAIAIIMVVIFHAFPTFLRGGYAGVDVFFVISGYLIGSVIERELERGKFNFMDFYMRRVRRLFPALITALIACLGFGWFVLMSNEYEMLGKHVAGGAAMIDNLIFWKESGYFDIASEFKPLLHLWSLGVEEQFYIAWPLMHVILAGVIRSRLVFVILLSSVASLLSGYVFFRGNEAAEYFFPLTRFWEIWGGTMLAIHQAENGGKVRWQEGRASHFVSSLGLILIVFSALGVAKTTFYPGIWGGLPVLGALLLISAGKEGWVNRVLSGKYLVFIGLISYPLYLWHWPILSFAHILNGETPARVVRAALVILAVILSILTYWWVELPFRYGRASIRKVSVLVVFMCLVGIMGVVIHNEDGLKFRRFAVDSDVLGQAVNDWDYPGTLRLVHMDGVQVRKLTGQNGAVLLIGDSHLAQYASRYMHEEEAGTYHGKNLYFDVAYGCPPIPGVFRTDKPVCTEFQRKLNALASDQNVDSVVIGAAWNFYFMESPGGRGVEYKNLSLVSG